MKLLKTIVVLVFLITAVLNQDLQTNLTEFWSQITPIVHSIDNNTIGIVENEISCDLPEDILRNLITKTARNLGADELTFHKTSIHDNKYSRNVFTDCYFYNQETKDVYAWDITHDCFSTLNTTEIKQYMINGTNVTFSKFETIANANSISQLVDNNKDVWSTNISVLFVTNKQPPLCEKGSQDSSGPDKQQDIGNDKHCDTGFLKIEISVSVLVIVMIVVTIVCMCILRKKCLKHPKQRIRISYLKKITEHAWYQYEAFKRPICEKESEYEKVIEVHQYDVIGNGNKELFDDLGNKLERETPIYECPYTMNKSLVPVNVEPKRSDENDVAYVEIAWEK